MRKKIFAAALSGMMALSLVGNFPVGAEENYSQYGLGDLSLYEGMYKFSQLLNMSKEEFLALDETAQDCYYTVENTPIAAAECYYSNNTIGTNLPEIPDYEVLKSMYGNLTGLICEFHCPVNVNTDLEYIPFETEKCIRYLLGSAIEYTIYSPVYNPQIYPDWQFEVSLNDYSLKLSEITDEDILYVAKFGYCIQQAYSKFNISAFYNDKSVSVGINYGEADGNDKLTANDAAFIAKAIAEQREEELPETADFNGDGKITAFDCSKIAQFISAKALAKATGMISEQ